MTTTTDTAKCQYCAIPITFDRDNGLWTARSGDVHDGVCKQAPKHTYLGSVIGTFDGGHTPEVATRVINCTKPDHWHYGMAARVREFDGSDDLPQARICKLIDVAYHPFNLAGAASGKKNGPWPVDNPQTQEKIGL